MPRPAPPPTDVITLGAPLEFPCLKGQATLDPSELLPYATAAGPLSIQPTAVARPADADDVSVVLRWACQAGEPVVPRDAGTGMPGDVERRNLWSVRHAASPLIAESARSGLVSTQIIEDSAVPPEALGAYLSGVDEILRAAETDAVTIGHAGNANVHVNPLEGLWPQYGGSA